MFLSWYLSVFIREIRLPAILSAIGRATAGG
jgi:hypothetical protein